MSSDDTETKLAYKPKEAARRLDISLRTVNTLIATGELASVKIGRSRRITHEGIEKLLAKSAA